MRNTRFFIGVIEYSEEEITDMEGITHITIEETITKKEFKEQFPDHPLNKEVIK